MGMAAMLVMWPNSFVFIFIPILLQALNFGPKLPNCFWEKQVLTLKSEWLLTKVKEWPWPLIFTQLQKLI